MSWVPTHGAGPERCPLLQIGISVALLTLSTFYNNVQEEQKVCRANSVRVRVRVGARVNELKYVVLEPVYPIMKPLGWSLRV